MPNTAEILERLESSGTEIEGIAEPEEEGLEAGETETAEGEEKKPEPAKEPEKTEPKKPDADRVAAQFAALARTKQQAMQLQQAAEYRANELRAKEEQLASREKEVAEALANPDKIFELLYQHGLRDLNDLKAYAEKKFQPKPAPIPEDQKPMTAAQVQALLQQRDQEYAQARLRDQVYREFAALTDDDSKYEAAALLYDASERCKKADAIADEWNAEGRPWAMPDIADELEKRARQDARYAKMKARTAAKPDATKVASEASQQGSKANGAQVKPPEEAPPGETRKERIARLAARLK